MEELDDRGSFIQKGMDFHKGRVPMPATVTGPGSEPGAEDAARQRFLAQSMALHKQQEGNLSDDELAATWVGQEKVEGPGVGGFALRSKMSLFGDTFEERKVVFEKAFPEGGYQEVPNTDIVLYRKAPEDPWKKADPGFFESLASEYFVKEFGMDLADFTGDLPEVIGEAIATLVKVPGARGVVRPAVQNLFRMAAGAMIGSQAQQGAQSVAGTQRETAAEQGMRAVGEAGYSLIGGTFGLGVGGGVNLVQRRAVMKNLRPGAREAMEAAERLETPTIPLTQLSDSPFIMRLGRQASSLWRGLAQASRKVEEHSTRTMDALVDKGSRLNFLTEAEKATRTENRLIRETTEESVKYLRRHPRTRGIMLRERISDWWNGSSKQAVDDAYRVARSIEEPDFDLGMAVGRAREIKEGVWTPEIAKETEEATGLLNLFGEPMTQEAVEQGTRRLDPVPSGLEKLVDDILAIDPKLPDETLAGDAVPFSKTDRIRELYKRARDMSLPSPGAKPTEAELKAGSLAHTLRQTLENPTSNNATFLAAWRKAGAMAQDRFATREHLAVVDIMRTGQPSEIVDNLIINRKGTIDNLIAVRKAVDKETFEEIRHEFVRKMFDGERRVPGGMAKALDAMDPDVLKMLLPKTARKSMRQAAARYQELASTGVQRALERQTEVGAFIREVIDTDQTAGIEALYKLVLKQNGGTQSGFGRTVRAAILDEIIHKSTVKGVAGGAPGIEGALGSGVRTAVGELGSFDRISGKKLNATMIDFKERGLLKFLDGSDLDKIRDVELIQKLMDIAGTDAGTALVGAQTIKGVSQFSMDAVADMAHFLGTTRLLMNPTAIKVIAGGTKGAREGVDTQGIQLIGSMFSSLASDVGEQRDIPEYNALLGKPQEARQ